MKNTTIFIAFLLIFLSSVNSFPAVLEEIKKVEQFSTVQVHLSFDKTPDFSVDQTGRRIDILLDKTTPKETLVLPVEDQNIIRYATAKSKGLLTLSLFLRYLPEEYEITKIAGNKLVVNLVPGSEYTKSFKDFTRQLDGVSQSQANSTTYGTPLTHSPYRDNWKLFFSRYESDLNIEIPVRYSWPPFPLIQFLPPGYTKNIEILPKNLIESAEKGLWSDLNIALPKLITDNQGNTEKQKLLALTYGELLGRSGNFAGSYKQLYVLKGKYPTEMMSVFAEYLLLLIQAEHADVYLANYELKKIESKIPPKNSLLLWTLITEMETALTTGQLEQMNTLLLKDDVAFPPDAEKIKQVRQADYWNALHQPIKASAAYSLIEDKTLLLKYPASLNACCDNLYLQQKYQEASDCYLQLKPIVKENNALSLVIFRQLLSEYHAKKQDDSEKKFTNIIESFPEGEGGVRGLLKSYDLEILNTDDPQRMIGYATSYLEIGETSMVRAISEEAYFKSALASYLANDTESAINTLMKLHREFQAGQLRETTEALMLHILPLEIGRLFENKQYKELIILAQKNIGFFFKGWLDTAALTNVGFAYYRLGLYNEAHDIFLYLITKANAPTKKDLFIPLIQATYFSGRYSRVDDYATLYRYNYPADETNKDILIYQSKALFSLGKYQKALDLIPSPIPDDPDIQALAISIYFYNGEYKEALELFKKHSPKTFTPSRDTELRFMEAESLYQTGEYELANVLFQKLDKTSRYWPQSLYRQAEYFKKQNKRKEAIFLLEDIVKSFESSVWAKLATQDLAFLNNSSIQ